MAPSVYLLTKFDCSIILYSRFQFTFYQTTLPGKRDTKVRETVSTDMRILSASGSKMVPKTDFWFLKFLAMKPSSYKKKMWILTFKALMAASLTSDSYLMHRLEGTVHVPHLRISRENGYQDWVQWKALVVYSWWYSKQPWTNQKSVLIKRWSLVIGLNGIQVNLVKDYYSYLYSY